MSQVSGKMTLPHRSSKARQEQLGGVLVRILQRNTNIGGMHTRTHARTCMRAHTHTEGWELAHTIVGLASLKSVKQPAGWKAREELMLQS